MADMNNLEYMSELAEKWIAGTITDQEKLIFNEWYNSFDFSQLEMWVRKDFNEADFKEKIRARIKNQIPEFNEHRKTRRLWPRIAAAASVIFLLGIAGYFYSKHPQPPQQQVAKNDIAPGRNTATLTLANGQKIILSDAVKGKIAKQAGVNITKTANGQVVYTIAENNAAGAREFNTLSTAKGETYKINLPDGTQVWLNAASSLTYPARFTGPDRKVTLTGEGYFEVAKDKAHPFIVGTDKQDVTVLGTHFNINAYTNESATKTTLLEGSVRVSAENKDQIIKPGQQAALKDGNIKVQEIDADQTIAWKDNNFDFDGEDIQYIMRMVERWYNVEVVYDGYNSSEKYYGGVSRYENVSEVLKSLESTKKIHFKVEGRKIFVRK
jgi:ferric-dicitrate binding protein FerR (iron transport regulator)